MAAPARDGGSVRKEMHSQRGRAVRSVRWIAIDPHDAVEQVRRQAIADGDQRWSTRPEPPEFGQYDGH